MIVDVVVPKAASFGIHLQLNQNLAFMYSQLILNLTTAYLEAYPQIICRLSHNLFAGLTAAYLHAYPQVIRSLARTWAVN